MVGVGGGGTTGVFITHQKSYLEWQKGSLVIIQLGKETTCLGFVGIGRNI